MAADKYFPIYFAPDLDPSWGVNPGLLIDVAQLIPTKRNTLASYAASSTQDLSGSFSSATYGVAICGAIVQRTNGTGRMIVGTTKRLMEHTGTAWVDVSAGGADYSAAADWNFTTFGNDLIAVSKANAVQVSTAQASAFTALAGAPPKASVCASNKNFVLLGDCNDGTNDLGDQIWWCGLGNDTTWTVSASTQAGNYRLRDTPGKVTALVNLRDTVVAYKEDAVYVGNYQGAALQWTWRLVSDKVGCAASKGVVVVNGIHYFLHRTGVFRFDGASVQPIGQSVNKFLFTKMGKQSAFASAQAVYDEHESVIIWYFKNNGASGAASGIDCGLALNIQTGQFGYIDNVWEAVAGASVQGVVSATLAGQAAWDATLGASTNSILTVGATSGTTTVRKTAFAAATTSTTMRFYTGDVGDETSFKLLRRIKPRMFTLSGNTSAIVYGKDNELDTFDSGTTFTTDTTKQRCDGMKINRWFKIYYTVVTKCEIAGLYLDLTPHGTE